MWTHCCHSDRISCAYPWVRVIYHLHETSMNPPVLKWFLKKVVKLTASHVVYVSRFLQEKEPVQGPNAHVVYNALSEEFRSRGRVHQYEISDKKKFTVLMLCSLKEYKGVNEFVTLARRLHLVRFELVLNSSKEEIEKYFLAQELPHNLIIFPKQKNVHPFYERAHLVLNLSHPDKWIETFGMTILEGMSYGIRNWFRQSEDLLKLLSMAWMDTGLMCMISIK